MTPEQQGEDHYRRRLATRKWVYQERTVGEGEEVTVTGSYRAAEGAIDVSYGVSRRSTSASRQGSQDGREEPDVDHRLRDRARAAAAAMHYAAYADAGALYRGLIENLGLSE